ncbi:hypothetical protein BHE74_00038553 [Ensete ventricosum]|nr:hypothetical protein BHE74_00038553 [Ensete ventricosum]
MNQCSDEVQKEFAKSTEELGESSMVGSPIVPPRSVGCLTPIPRCYDTENFFDMKNQIEDLIHRGHLSRYVRKLCKPSPHPKGPVEKQIDVIIGGPTSGGDNCSVRKAYA